MRRLLNVTPKFVLVPYNTATCVTVLHIATEKHCCGNLRNNIVAAYSDSHHLCRNATTQVMRVGIRSKYVVA